MDIQNRKVAVLGLGMSGFEAAKLALSRGAQVVVLDSCQTESLQKSAEKLKNLGAEVHLNIHSFSDKEIDLAVISPGVLPEDSLRKSIELTVRNVYSELEFGWSFLEEIPLVAVTGTNGKTTTTELCSCLLKSGGFTNKAAGNIGYPVSALAQEPNKYKVNVFEVSSFQLEHVESFRPHIGILTNITPDHLERHGSMESYIREKLKLFIRQRSEDWALVEAETLRILRSEYAHLLPSTGWFDSKVLTYSSENQQADIILKEDKIFSIGQYGVTEGEWLDINQIHLKGNHNIENVMAAMGAALIMGVDLKNAANAAKTFLPSGHRCELVAEIDGIQYIDDSKATNLDATRQALKMMPKGKKTWLIAGGKDKGFSFYGIEDLLSERVKMALLIGETRSQIADCWQRYVPCMKIDSLEECVRYAGTHAEKGEIVLLSPACSSFDMFASYHHRGMVFKKSIEYLKC